MFFNTVPQVSIDEVKKSSEENSSSVIIIDVRTIEEHQSGKIKNSINIPLAEDFIQKISSTTIDDKTIYLYCRSGARSTHAANLLIEHGYVSIYNMTDGILAWKAKGFELI